MKTKIMLAFLVITLAACAPAQLNTTDIQNTALAMARTGVVLTLTALPTATLPPPTFTPTASPTSTPEATATQTQSIAPTPIITPDTIQVEKWKEYQAELAKVVLSFNPDHPEGYDPEAYKDALCEWDILGQSGQEVYVWAMCASTDGLNRPMNPAVIYLKPDGSIREINIVRAGMDRRNQLAVYDLHLFPLNVQEKLCLYYFQGIVPQCGSIIPDYVPLDYGQTRESVLLPHLYYRIDHLEYGKGHLEYKEGHPEEPPLIILSAMPISTPPATPTPTQPIVPIITPDAIQVERWKEYEDALAQSIFPTLPFEPTLCEWDILAQSGEEVYVWAVCASSKMRDRRPAVIHLGGDGSVHSVEIPKRGSHSDINRMFPEEAQAKFSFYSGDSLFNGRPVEMLSHLNYRETHPEEPPLIVLSATPTQ